MQCICKCLSVQSSGCKSKRKILRVKMASSPHESWPSYSGKQLSLVLVVVLTLMMQSTVVCTQKHNVKKSFGGKWQNRTLVQTKTSVKYSNMSSCVPSLSPRSEHSPISWDSFFFFFEMSFWLNPKKTRTEICTFFVIRALQRGCVEAERVNASAKKKQQQKKHIHYLLPAAFLCSSLLRQSSRPTTENWVWWERDEASARPLLSSCFVLMPFLMQISPLFRHVACYFKRAIWMLFLHYLCDVTSIM